MPIYEYRKKDKEKGCKNCCSGFEVFQSSNSPNLDKCPECGSKVEKIISGFSWGVGGDLKAKHSGLHKLVKKDKGVYEKLY
jgi:putative FmdB family regulatory protein